MTGISGEKFIVPSMETLGDTLEESHKLGAKLIQIRLKFEKRAKQLGNRDMEIIYDSLSALIALAAYNMATSLTIIRELTKDIPIKDQVKEEGKHIDLIEDIIESLSSNIDSLRKRVDSHQ